ncbi:menaquinone biosynthesis protein [Planctomycetota bacterium]|nr:menaquinone biosynthesis protein [Planctomycetota bacterium]
MPETSLNVGVVAYVNALPLWCALTHEPDLTLVPDTPAKLSMLMNAGKLDIGLLPIIEMLRHPTWNFFPDLGVAADGTVDSVGLFVTCEPSECKTVALTSTSRTSVALTEVVLDGLGATPEYRTTDIQNSDLANMTEDAVLLIGDQCLQARNADHGRIFVDLAAEWKLLTGLPFVFAAWCGPCEKLTNDLHMRLQDALKKGRHEVLDYVESAALDTGLKDTDLTHYIFETIKHDLNEECRKGLLEFTRRAAKLDLVPNEAIDRVLTTL